MSSKTWEDKIKKILKKLILPYILFIFTRDPKKAKRVSVRLQEIDPRDVKEFGNLFFGVIFK